MLVWVKANVIPEAYYISLVVPSGAQNTHHASRLGSAHRFIRAEPNPIKGSKIEAVLQRYVHALARLGSAFFVLYNRTKSCS